MVRRFDALRMNWLVQRDVVVGYLGIVRDMVRRKSKGEEDSLRLVC